MKPIVGVLTFQVMFMPCVCRKMALLQFHLLAFMSRRTLSDLTGKIDLGSNESYMTLHRKYREDGKLIWCDVMKGEAVKSPVDIDALPVGVYRLTKT